MDKWTIYSDVALLHPEFRRRAVDLLNYLERAYKTGVTKTRFEIFETFRSPLRQAQLLAEGRSKARPFESAHSMGLAADFVPFLTQAEGAAIGAKPGWNWSEVHDWAFLKRSAEAFNLKVPIAWDKVHVEHPDWPKIADELFELRR